MKSTLLSEKLLKELEDLCWTAINAADTIEHEEDETEIIKEVKSICLDYMVEIKKLVS